MFSFYVMKDALLIYSAEKEWLGEKKGKSASPVTNRAKSINVKCPLNFLCLKEQLFKVFAVDSAVTTFYIILFYIFTTFISR